MAILRVLPDPETGLPVRAVIAGRGRAMVMSDIHFPFHDPSALRIALAIVRKTRPDIIILNGDIIDNHAISRFPRPPIRRAGFHHEVRAVRILLHSLIRALRRFCPRAPILYLEGNHEERMEAFLTRVQELYDLPELRIPALYQLDGLATYLFNPRLPQSVHGRVQAEVDIGGVLIVTHGHKIRQSANTIHVARGLAIRLHENIVVGHWHRNAFHIESTYRGQKIQAYVVGCLCLQRPEYDASRLWGQGVLMIDFDAPEKSTSRPSLAIYPIPIETHNGHVQAFVPGHARPVRVPSRPRPFRLDDVWAGKVEDREIRLF